MNEDLSILPPDTDVFHNKVNKTTSEKQKAHLERARAKARESIEQRKLLQRQNMGEKITNTLPKSDDDEEVEGEEEILKVKGKTKNKKVELTEEEVEARRFDKFMRQMKKYEQHKEQLKKEEEEAKKIKLSLTNEEYEELVKILDKEEELANKKKDLEQESPALPKKVEQSEPITSIHRALRPKTVTRGRFGK